MSRDRREAVSKKVEYPYYVAQDNFNHFELK